MLLSSSFDVVALSSFDTDFITKLSGELGADGVVGNKLAGDSISWRLSHKSFVVAACIFSICKADAKRQVAQMSSMWHLTSTP